MIIRDHFDGKSAEHAELSELSSRELRRMVRMGSREAAREWARRRGTS